VLEGSREPLSSSATRQEWVVRGREPATLWCLESVYDVYDVPAEAAPRPQSDPPDLIAVLARRSRMLSKRARTRVLYPVGVIVALALSTLSATVALAGSGAGPHGYQGPKESPRPGVVARAATLSPSCSGYGCDNTDPVQTGCSNSAYTASSAPITVYGSTVAYVDNRYSTSCRTNWSRVRGTNGDAKTAQICRTNGYCASPYSSYSATIYSNQVYAPSPICATAYGQEQVDAGWAFGNTTAC
jgi:Protein of unknown function (DUF2690)